MDITVQIVAAKDRTPQVDAIEKWCATALTLSAVPSIVTVRAVGMEEGRELNERFRHGTGATNVLAFPIEELDLDPRPIGDVVVCAPIANLEALRDHKSEDAHWAHLVIHGTLHLLGYDHIKAVDAQKMESLEKELLASLGYADPYL